MLSSLAERFPLLRSRRIATAVLAAAGLAAVAGTCKPVQPAFRWAQTVLNTHFVYSDQEIVDILDQYPNLWHVPRTWNARPLGHPDLSTQDCDATPDSVGCRNLRIQALAASQGVTADRMCVSLRIDIHRKWPGYELDSFPGLPFDPAWLLHVPGDEYEAAEARWRGGVIHPGYLDTAWVEENQDACCHDGLPGTCTAQDRCLAFWGTGDDVAQQFTANSVGMDLRNPAYRTWSVERFLAKAADTASDCVMVSYKPGSWVAHEGPDGLECRLPEHNTWKGSALPWDPCANAGLTNSPYAPGEYEAALNAFFWELLDRLGEPGMPDLPALTIERSDHLGVKWVWMDGLLTRHPGIEGEVLSNVTPFREPQTSVVVYFLPPPESGPAPLLDVDVSVDVRGNAKGDFDLYVWCDCTNKGTDLAQIQLACGTEPGRYHELLGQPVEPLVLGAACDYPDPGTYVLKSLVFRDGVWDEDRIAVNAD